MKKASQFLQHQVSGNCTGQTLGNCTEGASETTNGISPQPVLEGTFCSNIGKSHTSTLEIPIQYNSLSYMFLSSLFLSKLLKLKLLLILGKIFKKIFLRLLTSWKICLEFTITRG